MRERRRTLTPEERAAASEIVCAKLASDSDISLRVDPFDWGSPVAVYLASPQEIDLSPFIRKMLETGVRVVAPRWNGETYELAVLKGMDEAHLRKGPMGILEPIEAEIVSPKAVDVWLVPGLAFTRNGKRLGYGGGWYDRLLAEAPKDAWKIGIAHAFQVMDDLPSEPHDVPLVDVAAALASLPDWRRRKAASFRFDADRRRSVAVWMLLRQMLSGMGLDADSLPVTEDEFGKSAFDPSLGIHFNLSHAGERVMAAVSDRPVGCDVERIVPFDEAVARECLTDRELATVKRAQPGSDRDKAFIRLWVRKEACVKAVGRGLGIGLKSVSVLPGESPQDWSFHGFDFADGHLGCVASVRQHLGNAVLWYNVRHGQVVPRGGTTVGQVGGRQSGWSLKRK